MQEVEGSKRNIIWEISESRGISVEYHQIGNLEWRKGGNV